VTALLLCTVTLALANAPPAEEVARAHRIRDNGDPAGARQALKAAARAHPDSQEVHLALAQHYLAEGNTAWALRTAGGFALDHPPACDSRALEAWIRIQQADLDGAGEALEDARCQETPESAARVLLLQAKRAVLAGRRQEGRDLLRRARESRRHYAGDLHLLAALEQDLDPGYLPLWSWKVNLAAGGATNAAAGSPADLRGGSAGQDSPVVQADVQVRGVVPLARGVRPTVEAQFRALEYAARRRAVQDLSYRQPTLRTGLLLGESSPRLQVSHTLDAVQMAGGDRHAPGPLWFSQAQRLDLELEAEPALFAFGGAGRRRFREGGRSRWEVDGGAATMLVMPHGVRLQAGVSLRGQDARNPAYDLLGATVLVLASTPLPQGGELRQSLSTSLDHFPFSAGAFSGGDQARTDGLLQATVWLSSPSWHGLRAGLELTHTNRRSTAPDYAFHDNRVLAHATWALDLDRLGRTEVPARVLLSRATSTLGAGADTHIRDLMRQDEALKRGSSCLK
jgi:hypothetical protein